MDSIGRLPKQILWMVFSELGANEFHILRFVCNKWRHIINSDDFKRYANRTNVTLTPAFFDHRSSYYQRMKFISIHTGEITNAPGFVEPYLTDKTGFKLDQLFPDLGELSLEPEKVEHIDSTDLAKMCNELMKQRKLDEEKPVDKIQEQSLSLQSKDLNRAITPDDYFAYTAERNNVRKDQVSYVPKNRSLI